MAAAADHTNEAACGKRVPYLEASGSVESRPALDEKMIQEICESLDMVTAVAKSFVDADRNASAREKKGYSTLMGKLCLLEASTKNDVIVGIPGRYGAMEKALKEQARVEEERGSPVMPSGEEGSFKEGEKVHKEQKASSAFGALAALPYHVDEDKAKRCGYYVKRKKRHCALMATDGSLYCSQHQEGALERERARCVIPKLASEVSKGASEEGSGPHTHRISATQNRMVNPFAKGGDEEEMEPLPDWSQVFDDPNLPLLIDIGCARGGCLVHLSNREASKWNFLGLETRGSLVKEALGDIAAAREKTASTGGTVVRNLHYMQMNVMDSERFEAFLASLLPYSLPHGGGPVVAGITIQFPDPWSKSSRQRRRLIGPVVCGALQRSVAVRSGAWVYISSDVPDMVASGSEALSEAGFETWKNGETRSVGLGRWLDEPPTAGEDGLLGANPLGAEAPSEREIVCELKWRKVYRVLMVKR